SADLGAFVPVDAEPFEAIENRLQRLGTIALGVRVIDAQDELSAMFPGVEPVEQRGAYAADVQVPSWTRSKTCAYSHSQSQKSGVRNEEPGVKRSDQIQIVRQSQE